MANDVTVECANPSSVELTVTATFTLLQWEAILKIASSSVGSHYALTKFCDTVRSAVSKWKDSQRCFVEWPHPRDVQL